MSLPRGVTRISRLATRAAKFFSPIPGGREIQLRKQSFANVSFAR